MTTFMWSLFWSVQATLKIRNYYFKLKMQYNFQAFLTCTLSREVDTPEYFKTVLSKSEDKIYCRCCRCCCILKFRGTGLQLNVRPVQSWFFVDKEKRRLYSNET